MLSSESFMAFMFRSMIHSELSRYVVDFIYSYICPVALVPFFEKTMLSPLNCLRTLAKNQSDIHVGLSPNSNLLH